MVLKKNTSAYSEIYELELKLCLYFEKEQNFHCCAFAILTSQWQGRENKKNVIQTVGKVKIDVFSTISLSFGSFWLILNNRILIAAVRIYSWRPG